MPWTHRHCQTSEPCSVGLERERGEAETQTKSHTVCVTERSSSESELKAKAVHDMQNEAEMGRILCMMNYLARFAQNLANDKTEFKYGANKVLQQVKRLNLVLPIYFNHKTHK